MRITLVLSLKSYFKLLTIESGLLVIQMKVFTLALLCALFQGLSAQGLVPPEKPEVPVVSVRYIRRPFSATQRLGGFRCNHDIKKSFTSKPLNYFEPEMRKATAEQLEICPNVVGTCCSAREMNMFRNEGNSYMEVFKIYLESVTKLHVKMTSFNTTSFLDDVRNIRNKPDSCMKEPLTDDIELDILNMNLIGRQALKMYERSYQNYQQFYMGFLCSICNIRQQQAFQVKDNSKLTIEIDVTMCQGILARRYMHYQVAEIMFRIYDIVKQVSCLYVDHLIDKDIIQKMRAQVKTRLGEVQACTREGQVDLKLLFTKECKNLCRSNFDMVRLKYSYDFLALSKIMIFILKKFAERQFSITKNEKEILMSQIYNINSPTVFYRTFDIWAPTINNIYTDQKFDVTFSYGGLNFYDNNVNVGEFNYYKDSAFLQYMSGSASRLQSIALTLGLAVAFRF